MKDLITLIAQLEAITDPDPEMDAELAMFIYPRLYDCPRDDWGGQPGWRTSHGRVYALPYTGSLDAALPGEDIIGTSEQTTGKWVAVHRMPQGKMTVSGMGHTEAIARRIATLRAAKEKQ